MAKAGGCMTKILHIYRGSNYKQVERRHMSKLAGANGQAKTRRSVDYSSIMPNGDDQNDTTSWYWMPDARTGIYVPKGHEWVMEDVPEGAASFKQTYWLRNIDGVDKPQPDI